MSTIAAGTSAGTALVSTGDTTGALVLQTNGTTTAVTIATNQVVTLAQPLPVGSGGTGATSLSGLTVGTATTATNLAGGSNGTIPYQSAAGTTQMLAVGTPGQVLQTNGAGAPTWVTAGGGAVTIASGSFPAAASLSITNIPATYVQLVLQITGASAVSTGQLINVQVSTDNGSSFDTTSTNYMGTVLQGGSTPAQVSRATLVQSNSLSAAEAATGTISLFSYQGGTYPQFISRASNSINDLQMSIGHYTGSTSAVNALRINWSGGVDFDAGSYVLKGIS